jgi:hypothetical protein
MGQRDVERRLGRLLTDAAVQQCFLQDRARRGRVSFVESSWRRTSSRRCFACHADDLELVGKARRPDLSAPYRAFRRSPSPHDHCGD